MVTGCSPSTSNQLVISYITSSNSMAKFYTSKLVCKNRIHYGILFPFFGSLLQYILTIIVENAFPSRGVPVLFDVS